ncbi:GNAT family N-acetyltransferase [Bizionia sp. KMM 8389]
MKRNPFTSLIYQKTWLKYFAKNQSVRQFSNIKNLYFVKHEYLPFYINTGKNMTNGVTYKFSDAGIELKNTALVVYDVPEYCDESSSSQNATISINKVRQYKGFLANLSHVSTFDEYLQNTLNAKSRNKFRSGLRKFETCFDVSYKYYYGAINTATYNQVMANFKNLVEKRYDDLKIDTSLVSEWPFYEELVLEMIRNKQALIVSIEIADAPISMSLAFIGNNTLVGAVKAFDSAYYKFNVGHIEISKFIEWCLNNNISILDFSKGEYEYKTKWTNQNYLYNCHVIYNKSRFRSRIIGKLLVSYFEFKQYLRDKNFNLFIAKTRFQLKNKFAKQTNKPSFKIHKTDTYIKDVTFELVDFKTEFKTNPFLKRLIFDGLYQKPESFYNLEIYKQHKPDCDKTWYKVMGTKRTYFIELY